MRAIILTENTTENPRLTPVHGLSVWLETGKECVLFDVGPGMEFIKNAAVLNIPVENADICVISHGHYDHGGGLKNFLACNTSANVYVAAGAFAPHYHMERYIGLDASISSDPRIHCIDSSVKINDRMMLITPVPGNRMLPPANEGMRCNTGTDNFQHEQVLVVEENGIQLLLGGCAHRGLVNILEECKRTTGRYPDYVLSGLHLAAGGKGHCMADQTYLQELADYLLGTRASIYTCHCTGEEAYLVLKNLMGERINRVSAGDELYFG